jgi:hypothetical protein
MHMKKVSFDQIGYYGRPISELSREELLEAFAELALLLEACEDKDKKFREILGDKKYKTLEDLLKL